MKEGTESLAANRYLLLAVRAKRPGFTSPTLPSKQAGGLVRHSMQLCLMFYVPQTILYGVVNLGNLVNLKLAEFSSVAGGCESTFSTDPLTIHEVKALKKARRMDLRRAVGMFVSRPERWDKYLSPACWIKRTQPEHPSLSGRMFLFKILFGRKAHTSLDTLVPQMDGDDAANELYTFLE